MNVYYIITQQDVAFVEFVMEDGHTLYSHNRMGGFYAGETRGQAKTEFMREVRAMYGRIEWTTPLSIRLVVRGLADRWAAKRWIADYEAHELEKAEA